MCAVYLMKIFDKTMKKRLIAAVCCAGVLFAGCGQAEELDSMGENLEMSMVASIEGSDNSGASRYAGATPNAAAFASDDAVGMAVGDGDFVKWTFDGTDWEPEGNTIYWQDRETKYTFNAFYPYTEVTSKTAIKMPNLVTQDGTMSCVAQRDFLVATTSQDYGTNGVVSFTGDHAFVHVSALVTLTLKAGADLTSATLNKISFSGESLVSESTYSFTEGVSISDDGKDALNVSFTQKNMTSAGENFYFIVNTGTVALDEIKLSIDYTSGGTSYKAEASGILGNSTDKFESGKLYSYTVTVVDQALRTTGNEIKDWVNGISLNDIVIGGKEKEESQS